LFRPPVICWHAHRDGAPQIAGLVAHRLILGVPLREDLPCLIGEARRIAVALDTDAGDEDRP
jgi:hypothetical protein